MVLLFNIIEDHGVLRYFLRYYQMRGVTHFICGVHCGAKNPHFTDIEGKLRDYPHTTYCSYCEEFSGSRDVESQNRVRREMLDPDAWYLIADPDEFHHHAAFPSFARMGAAAQEEGADFVESVLVDRLPGDGKIVDLDLELSLDEQFPLAGHIAGTVMGARVQKVVMARSVVPIGPGHHFGQGRTASFVCQTHHFKWQGRDFRRRMEERLLAYRRLGVRYWAEPLRFLDYYDKCGRRINLGDSSLGVVTAERIGV